MSAAAKDPTESELRAMERNRRAQERAERCTRRSGGADLDQPTPAEGAAERAAEALANIERGDGFAAICEAIEDAVVNGKPAVAIALASLGKRTAKMWVDQLWVRQLAEVQLDRITVQDGAR